MEPDNNWTLNYYNYFTETEEHFQKARGTGLFMMSPLDWAIIEGWKEAGIPLEAVLRGIDRAFEKWHAKKKRGRMINSLAYCIQAVTEEAQSMAAVVPAKEPGTAAAPFSLEELRAFLNRNAQQIRQREDDQFGSIAEGLEKIIEQAGQHYEDLEQLEQRLSALEDKMSSLARAHQSDEDLFQIRRELDGYLRPYRGNMTAEQLTMLEKQFLDRRLLENTGLPRLSVFYL